VDKVEETEQYSSRSLQELVDQIHFFGRCILEGNPEGIDTVSVSLNEALQLDPCFLLEDYQVRVLQLRLILNHLRDKRLVSLLNQHLVHAEQGARALVFQSRTPVQDSIWPLYERILHLPTLAPDLFGAAVATLEEILPRALESHVIERLNSLIPRLLPPSHFFRGQSEPYTAALEQFDAIK
jgi:hypothetical protein